MVQTHSVSSKRKDEIGRKSTDVCRVLVVEDDENILELMLNALDSQNYICHSARNGEEGLQAAKQFSPDMIITDIRMPIMSGAQMVKDLQESGQEIPSIFTTGYAEYQLLADVIKLHPFGFIEKPFRMKELLQVVNKCEEAIYNKKNKEEIYNNLKEEFDRQAEDLQFKNECIMVEKKMLTDIFSNANFGMLAIDTFKMIHLVNNFAKKIFQQLKPGFFISPGVNLQQLASLDLTGLLNDLFDTIMKDNNIHEVNYVCNVTGNIYNIISYPVRHKKQTTAIVYVFHDISEKENLQKRLLQTEKLASIGELAAGVAHEINNPLGFISSNINVLKDYCSQIVLYSRKLTELCSTSESSKIDSMKKEHEVDFIYEDLSELLNETTDGVERVSKIVSDLKLFAREDAGHPQQVLIRELVENALNLTRNELKYKMTVETSFEDTTEVSCYPNRIVQVFTNLFVNAAHAIESEGTLTIHTFEEDDGVYITIADTGQGIPEQALSKIFDPFFTTKEPGKGTGMGLSISYSIIEKHNGTITVKSTEGKGTTFTIAIPFTGIETGR